VELCYVVTCGHSCIMIVAVPWLGQFLVFHCGGPGLIPGQSMWDLWWINWKWSRCFSKYFSVDLTVLFHQWSMLFFHSPATDACVKTYLSCMCKSSATACAFPVTLDLYRSYKSKIGLRILQMPCAKNGNMEHQIVCFVCVLAAALQLTITDAMHPL
jgi:hypothetical protein